MTASSIASASSTAYAEYLDAKSNAPGRGDYYLGRDGLPVEAPGRWHAPAAVLERFGIDPSSTVGREALEALMEGRAPGSSREQPVWLRAAGADGTRAAGLDVTFSAPKSVSVTWALAEAEERVVLEDAHRGAVADALGYLQETVPTVAVYQGPGLPKREVPASGLLTAEFLHTTARGVDGGIPDPQLHSHCVITSALRADGTVAAVRSRPVFRSAREVGAYYRAALAERLGQLGYEVEQGTGKDGRYFELVGVGEDVRVAFSRRTEEVARAAERFRAEHGRAPERGELREMKLASRQAKQPRTRGELDESWRSTAHQAGQTSTVKPELANTGTPQLGGARDRWADGVQNGLTADRAMFTERELRTAGLEQAPGRLGARAALTEAQRMREDGRVLELENGSLTTQQARAREQRTLAGLEQLAAPAGASPGRAAQAAAARQVGERLGGGLSAEQEAALRVLTGPERAAVLIGPAGTGKGVVIDAAARAELEAGRRVLGVAVAGSTAERLGRDSPALAEKTVNVDALLARVAGGQMPIDAKTTVIFDEAGMADTARLEALTTAVQAAGGKLVLVGDAKQLASIGPGGLFARAAELLPTVELEQVRRTTDPEEQQAWRELRAGEPEKAMAHYRGRGQLHLADSRDEALQAAVTRYDQLAQEHGVGEVALMSDGSTLEIDRMNARAQRLRAARGQLGEHELALPTVAYGVRSGDRITWTAPQPVEQQPRVENGSRGEVVELDPDQERARVRLDGTGRLVDVAGEQLGALRLAYAQHLYRQQGATVTRAVTLTGGWQTSREGAYVQASRARQGIDWHVGREELGEDLADGERLDRLAARMRLSGAQIPSIAFDLADPRPGDPGRELHLARGLSQPARQPAPAGMPGPER